ncbi:MAG TPA: Maf family protein [Burkholderiaceae bacterium]
MKPVNQKIYLASKSPRRRELLRQIGVDFELLMLRTDGPRGPDVSEIVHIGELPADYVARVTQEKAAFAAGIILNRRLTPRPVLAADTTVVVDNEILGKPADADEARAMLRMLSGRVHQVMTSVAIHNDTQNLQVTQVSDVTFDTLSDAQIEAYCATPEPYDKAGAYAIQGMGALFIKHIEGSHSGIMGLPLFETAQLLRQAGIKV